MEQPHSVALLVPEIKELLQAKEYFLLKQVIRECSPLDFGGAWKSFNEEEGLQIFKLLPATSAMKVFEILDIEEQQSLLERMNEEGVAPILEGMNSPDLAKIFTKMPPRVLSKMKSLIRRQGALSHIDLLMKFPRNTAGSLMHPEFLKLTPKLTAKQALSLLQAVTRPNQKEYLYSLFVTDETGVVLGALTLQDLVSAPEDVKLSELMTSVEPIKVSPEMDQEDVSQVFSKYQISAAPVVEESGRLIGILTVKDIISVVRQEATEDIAKMVGTKAVDVMERSVFRIVEFRMPWLLVTLAGGILISTIIRSFEPLLSRILALASFSPLIAGMAGNVGSQSATIVVRSIALGRLDRGQKMKTIFREFSIGLMLGLIYGSLLGALAFLIYGYQYHFYFSMVVAIGMCTAMTVAATMGAIGPLLFDHFGIDPATATGPLVTTITDIISNLTYFTLATILLAGF